MKNLFFALWISLSISTAYAQNPPPLTLPPSPVSPSVPAINMQPFPAAAKEEDQLNAIPLSPGLETYRSPSANESAPDAAATSAATAAGNAVPTAGDAPPLPPIPPALMPVEGAAPITGENLSSSPPLEAPPQQITTGIPYDVAPPPLTLPGAPDAPIPLPGGLSALDSTLPPPPAIGTLDALTIPSGGEVVAEKEKKAEKIPSWKQPLKPSSVPVKTDYEFRRTMLPSTIYRNEYDPANRTLPTARTNALYDHYFLLAVARNDLNGIRAMLANGYRDVNIFNADGDTALIVAIRHNAIAAARLLIARGADPYLTGKGGYSAYDYARQLNNPELNAALEGIFG